MLNVILKKKSLYKLRNYAKVIQKKKKNIKKKKQLYILLKRLFMCGFDGCN